jgi:hypothetical protein
MRWLMQDLTHRL